MRLIPYERLGLVMLVAPTIGCSATARDDVSSSAEEQTSTTEIRYIVYLQPGKQTALYNEVSVFLASHTENNKAAFYPPHVTVTPFFEATMSVAEVEKRIAAALPTTSPGQPAVTYLDCAKPGLIKIHISAPYGYQNVALELNTVFGIPSAKPNPKKTTPKFLPFAVEDYHLTLFQAKTLYGADEAFTAALCDQADVEIGDRNRFNAAGLPWDISLYRLFGDTMSGTLTLLASWETYPSVKQIFPAPDAGAP